MKKFTPPSNKEIKRITKKLDVLLSEQEKLIERCKQEFIGNYLDKKMKNHNLPMSMQYYSLLGSMTEKAEKAWNRKINKAKQQ